MTTGNIDDDEAAETGNGYDRRRIVDFSTVQAAAPILPPDTYSATVGDITVGTGQESGALYYRITFEVEPPDGGPSVPVEEILSFSERALGRTYEALCTIAGERLPQNAFDVDEQRPRFIGQPCRLKLAPGWFGDREINDVRRIMPPLSTLPGAPRRDGLMRGRF